MANRLPIPNNPRRVPLKFADCWCPKCTLGHSTYVVIGFPYTEWFGKPIIACCLCTPKLWRQANPAFRRDTIGNLCEIPKHK